MGDILAIRNQLEQTSEKEGLLNMLILNKKNGMWDSMRSWAHIDDPNVICIRYEDLIGQNRRRVLADLLNYLEIDLDSAEIQLLSEKYSFEKMSGRKSGEEDDKVHLRKGVANDWKNYFDDEIIAEFKRICGDLVPLLGYEDFY